MWLFYKEKKYPTISVITIILDGIIIYLIPSFFNQLNYFYPMLTVSLIPFLYHDNFKKYYYYVFFLGFIYDILYSNIFLYNVVIFLFLAVIDKIIIKYLKNSLLLFILLVIINIIIYDSIFFIFIFITNYQSVELMDLVYKIEHSLLLNIMSVFVFFFMFNKEIRIHKM